MTASTAPRAIPTSRGVLLAGSPGTNTQYVVEAFRQGLRGLDYVEDRNITIEYRFAEGRLDRSFDLASELVRLPVDVIVAPGTALPKGPGGQNRSELGLRSRRVGCSSLKYDAKTLERTHAKDHRNHASHSRRRHAGARWPRGGSEERVHPRRLGHALRRRRWDAGRWRDYRRRV